MKEPLAHGIGLANKRHPRPWFPPPCHCGLGTRAHTPASLHPGQVPQPCTHLGYGMCGLGLLGSLLGSGHPIPLVRWSQWGGSSCPCRPVLTRPRCPGASAPEACLMC